MKRREFARSMMAGLLLPAAGLFPERLQRSLWIAVLLPARATGGASTSFASGVEMGKEETLRAAALFSRGLGFIDASYTPAADLSAIVSRVKAQGTVLLVSALEEETAELSTLCDSARLVLLNGAARTDSLRRSTCSDFVFHVEASESMYRSAAQSVAIPQDSVALWSPALEKYGAAQLNDRYAARTGSVMDASAWAGWMCVKIAWEASIRASSAESRQIADYLVRESTAFDGHKGAPLSFRKWDHQLRQPLYAAAPVSGGRVSEIPDVAMASGSVMKLLDTIGDPLGMTTCTKGKRR
ncbi:MAG TPA: hypothetical protein VHM24_05285 [Gemmatimonadaceae bacterium]|nr:hypothetical protein [Gemmatimonadaceae bacterium]